VKASRFLARAFRADEDAAADAAKAFVRRRFHDATHHCWACRIGPPEASRQRVDDDGEPSGTAGAPILAALEAADVRDALIVVTRWFGGTKLGTGGLAHAYGNAARAALDAAPRRDVWLETLIVVECGWTDVGAVEAALAREGEGVRRCERAFDPSPRFDVALARSRAAAFREAIREATSGRARVG
jgi:uncharacterized YigZ family protein